MPRLLSKYATPFTTGLFLVSAISGIALFFHFENRLFHNMHIWLSLVLLIPFAFHIWKNWKPFRNYFKHWPMIIALAASLAAAFYYAHDSYSANRNRNGGGRPDFALLSAVQNTPVTNIAPVLGMAPEALITQLRSEGFNVRKNDSINDIVLRSGKPSSAVISAVLQQ